MILGQRRDGSHLQWAQAPSLAQSLLAGSDSIPISLKQEYSRVQALVPTCEEVVKYLLGLWTNTSFHRAAENANRLGNEPSACWH